jgi:hypothetical protein
MIVVVTAFDWPFENGARLVAVMSIKMLPKLI